VGEHRAMSIARLVVSQIKRTGQPLSGRNFNMARRVRHIQARPGEWIKVHRPRRRNNLDDYGWIIVVIFLLLLFRGC
jgi:hypothetical protein